jgi:N-acetylglucosaminyl-diphospho-decaprenol L-rhamnosyltransferase
MPPANPVDCGAFPSVAVVVVYYRTPECLRACLNALERQTRACDDVVVIDNSVGQDTAEPSQLAAYGWRLHRSATNLGFGAGCNAGARITTSDYLLFINADLTLSDEACERLCAAADDNPGAAVIGPRIFGANGEIELSARSFPSLWTGVLGRSTLATRLLRRVGVLPNAMLSALSDEVTTVDWVSGACMLMRRCTLDEVGGFDEDYWMYWEDADICRRLKDRGWGTILCTDAYAHHSTGSSGRTERTIEAFHSSAARYYERHVARNTVTARLARGILYARMIVILRRHARRTAI